MSARFDTQPLAFRIESEIWAQLREIANQQGCSLSDLLRRGALMVLEEPNRMVITWTSPPVVSLEPATVDADGRTGQAAGADMEAAIQAATKALGRASIGIQETADRVLAEAAVRAAEPILRQAVAEEIAVAVERSYSFDHEPQPVPRGRRELIEKVAGWCARIAREVGRG